MWNRCSPTLEKCTFMENMASNEGGGIYNDAGATVLSDCLFVGNQSNKGAGMSNARGIVPIWNPPASTFSGNIPDNIFQDSELGGAVITEPPENVNYE